MNGIEENDAGSNGYKLVKQARRKCVTDKDSKVCKLSIIE